MVYSLVIGAALVLAAQAQTVHDIATDGLAYSPNTIKDVAKGDKVRLTFSTVIPHNIHSSTLQAPCTYDAAGGLASGTYKNGQVFEWTVNSTDPAFFFCSVHDHCQMGMVLAINPTDTETIAMAQSNAKNTTSKAPASDFVVGGMLVSAGVSSNNSSMSMNGTSAAGGAASTSGSMTGSAMSSMTSAADSSMTSTAGSSMSTGGAASTSAPAGNTSSAYGLRSSIAMVAAIVGGAFAFVL